jgi:hypothetical protein
MVRGNLDTFCLILKNLSNVERTLDTFLYIINENVSIIRGALDTFCLILKNMSNAERTSDTFLYGQRECVHCKRYFGHFLLDFKKICPMQREHWTLSYTISGNVSIIRGALDTFCLILKNMSNVERTSDTFLYNQREYVHCKRYFGHFLLILKKYVQCRENIGHFPIQSARMCPL